MSTPPKKPTFRLPERAPSALDVRNREDWDALVDTSLARVTATADKWHAGLTGLVTVLTGLLVIKGPDGVGKLAPSWHAIVVVLFLAGIGLMLRALWLTQSAAAPPPRMLALDDVLDQHVTVRASQVAAARHVLELLATARRLAVCGLVTLLAGIAVWWLAPTSEPAAHRCRSPWRPTRTGPCAAPS